MDTVMSGRISNKHFVRRFLYKRCLQEKIKIVYCLPSLYIPGGMERVLTIKANYFAEKLALREAFFV